MKPNISVTAKWAGALALALLLVFLGRVSAQNGSPLAAQSAPTGLAVSSVVPLGKAFTYQGRLQDTNVPVNSSCDFQFGLFDTAVGGSQIGTTQTVNGVTVTDGLFTVQLNGTNEFGSNAFNGEARFLDIAVSCPSGGGFTPLSPRQALSATPYSSYSLSTGALQGNPVASGVPVIGDVLQWNGATWVPTAINGRRQYYLTNSTATGNQAITACSTGYHMASIWEIHDISGLLYNTTLGRQLPDSGDGPPASSLGWVRTGLASSVNTTAGNANCALWTSNLATDNGSTIGLNPNWLNPSIVVSPWDSLVKACNTNQRVWCVED